MISSFDILYTLHVRHGYYNRNPFTDFRFSPTACTASTMKANDLLPIQNYGRSQLCAPSVKNTDGAVLHHTVADRFSLLFFMETSNIYLDNISLFPERRPTEVPLFTNMDGGPGDPDTYELNRNTVVDIVGNSLTLPGEAWQTDTVTDCFGDAFELPSRPAGESRVFALSDLEEGVYRIATRQGTKYFTNLRLGFRQKPMALLHICSNDTLLNGRQITGPAYDVTIASPSLYWQYVFPMDAVDKYVPENLLVEASDRSVDFVRDEPDGQPYLTFTSAVPIPIEDRKDVRFRLKRVNSYDAQDTIIVSDLPFPDPRTLFAKSGQRITSPIFVKM